MKPSSNPSSWLPAVGSHTILFIYLFVCGSHKKYHIRVNKATSVYYPQSEKLLIAPEYKGNFPSLELDPARQSQTGGCLVAKALLDLIITHVGAQTLLLANVQDPSQNAHHLINSSSSTDGPNNIQIFIAHLCGQIIH